MKVILICGKAQHGKDTTAKLLETYLSEKGRVLVTHFADVLKFVCKSFFGWNGEKDEYGRWLLQYIGTDVVREVYPVFWYEFVASMLHAVETAVGPEHRKELGWDYVIIPDCRFPNEVNTFFDMGFDTTVVRVVRPNFVSPLTEQQQKHASEVALDDYVYDEVICNDGTIEDLAQKAAELAAKITRSVPSNAGQGSMPAGATELPESEKKLHTATIGITADARAIIERYLSDDLPEEDRLPAGQHIGYTARFDDGMEMDVKCCGCNDAPAFSEACLVNRKGGVICSTEPDEVFMGEWEFSTMTDRYVVTVVEVA